MSAPALPLPPPVAGERVEVGNAATGRVAAWVAGPAGTRALLLVHSVNAAASAAEVRPLFEHYARTRRVWAPDLPGFGASERSDRAYTPRLMTDALLATLDAMQRETADVPDVLAVSLGCEFAARAAVERPGALRSLALVSPTGFRGTRAWRAAPGSTRGVPALYRALRGPGWGAALFRQLTRPRVIRYFLERTWGSKAIDEDLWRFDVLTTRQPGAEHAPLHFLAGNLFSADVTTLYESLALPVWMSHGVRGDFTDYRGKRVVEARANWRLTVFPTGALPYFERRDEFVAAYDAFLGALAR
ncbi:alpha/beta fold hydrolase [Azohydromonas sediminis]|uniref:alpha/beta fold hydrolase n=1 Tax=Azohydromonas sediminis TaxID=2259674 RepID=UPI000E648DE5|nr:alpha/beta hydrolase [Azohydromonas sediminis]